MFKKIFGKKHSISAESHTDAERLNARAKPQRSMTVDPEMLASVGEDNSNDTGTMASQLKHMKPKSPSSEKPKIRKQRSVSPEKTKSPSSNKKKSSNSRSEKPKLVKQQPAEIAGSSSRRRRKKKGDVKVDVKSPIEYPCTPEMMLEYHKTKPFLTKNEEWLLVELNEFECLVENLEIIQIIAKHSKYFELDPDELWEEFMEFVDDVPSYDEIINYDVWQEFRDKRYPC